MNSGTYHLIGAGGTGSIIAPHLLRHLRKTHGSEFELRIVDGDTVSERNTSRQDFVANDVGKSKAEVLAERLGGADAHVVAVKTFIDKDRAKAIGEGDTVLIAVDNYRARADIEDRAMWLDHVTIINGGNEAESASCQIFTRRNGEHTAPPISFRHEEILTPGLTREQEGCMAHAESPDHEQTIAANLMSAAWMLTALYHVAKMDQEYETQRKVNIEDGVASIPEPPAPKWHEVHIDFHRGRAGGPDWREIDTEGTWRTYDPTTIQQPTIEASLQGA